MKKIFIISIIMSAVCAVSGFSLIHIAGSFDFGFSYGDYSSSNGTASTLGFQFHAGLLAAVYPDFLFIGPFSLGIGSGIVYEYDQPYDYTDSTLPSDEENRLDLNSVNIPVLLGAVWIAEGAMIYVEAGPYFNIGLGGNDMVNFPADTPIDLESHMGLTIIAGGSLPFDIMPGDEPEIMGFGMGLVFYIPFSDSLSDPDRSYISFKPAVFMNWDFYIQ